MLIDAPSVDYDSDSNNKRDTKEAVSLTENNVGDLINFINNHNKK